MDHRVLTDTIDELDRRVIAALQLNGRARWNAVARWVGVNETTVRRRYKALRERGLLRVVGTLQLDRTRAGSAVPEPQRITKALADVRPVDPRTDVAITGDWNRPVFERTPEVAALATQARRCAALAVE